MPDRIPINSRVLSGVLADYTYSQGDAFGRARVSQQVLELDAKFTSDLLPASFNQLVTAGGTVAHTAGTTRAEMAVTAAGDVAGLQLRYPLQYRAAQSQLVAMTGAFGASEAALTYEIGYLQGTDGIWMRETGGVVEIVLSDSYTATETAVAQAAWNRDTCDGTGDSGYDLDLTNGFILAMDMQYLGVGRVRVGFYAENGQLVWAHEFDNVGTAPSPYMRTANLRPTWRVTAGGAYVGAGAEMYAICCGAVREGAHEEPGRTVSYDTGVAAATATPAALTSALSIRLQAATSLTSIIRPARVSVVNTGANPLHWRLIRQTNADAPAAITGGAWTAGTGGSVSEVSTVAAAVTQTARDVVYASGYVDATNRTPGFVLDAIERVLPLGTAADNSRDILILCLQQVGGAASAYKASVRVQEFC